MSGNVDLNSCVRRGLDSMIESIHHFEEKTRRRSETANQNA